MDIAIEMARMVKAPVPVVFNALTNPAVLAEYTGPCTITLKMGGDIQLFDGWVTGKVIVYLPNSLWSFTWKPADWEADDENSVVSMCFKSTKTGTEILLKHSGFPNQTEADNHLAGWEEFVFTPLEAYLKL